MNFYLNKIGCFEKLDDDDDDGDGDDVLNKNTFDSMPKVECTKVYKDFDFWISEKLSSFVDASIVIQIKKKFLF